MAKQSLLKTNPYLKDPAKRRSLFVTTVSSSTAIEGVRVAVDKAISKKSAKPLVIPKDAKSGGSRR